jgi:2-methylisocitrate lyase-like PEP mutase family enzyme
MSARVNQSPAALLRERLKGSEILMMPACYDGLSARLVAQIGFPACLVSGYGVAGASFGLPDVGLVTQTEMATAMRAVCAAAPGFPFIADGDTGYGNAVSVRRTVFEYARAGLAGIMLEDQVAPKRCGHVTGKEVISFEEARLKIRAAVDVRRELGLDILIMARTDARGPLGLDEALRRCLAFQEEGADILFMEAPESVDEMKAFCRAVERPTMSNNFPGGKTPYLSAKALQDIGYKLATDATVFFSAVHAVRAHLLALKAGDDKALPPRVGFEDMKDVMGMSEHFAIDSRYKF